MITSNLKHIMDKEGITIHELSRRSNISTHTIFRVRSTALIRSCTLASLEKIAEALNRSPKELFEYEHNKYYENFSKLR